MIIMRFLLINVTKCDILKKGFRIMNMYVYKYLMEGLYLNLILSIHPKALPAWFHKGFAKWLCVLAEDISSELSESDIKELFNTFVFSNSHPRKDMLMDCVNKVDADLKSKLVIFFDLMSTDMKRGA